MLVDLRKKNITGKDAEQLLDRAAITVNKNTIPGDPQSPFVTSGIRLGTPALTTRGLKENDMETVAAFLDRAIHAKDDPAELSRIRQQVADFAAKFPMPH